jgi:putative tryptophan/tyrosine transport system substrate-binding protein
MEAGIAEGPSPTPFRTSSVPLNWRKLDSTLLWSRFRTIQDCPKDLYPPHGELSVQQGDCMGRLPADGHCWPEGPKRGRSPVLDIGRREFITLLGGAAVAWPLAAQAQQPAAPVIGYLDSRSPEAVADRLRGFRQGLKESGYIENENVAIAYRWAENQPDRLQELATDLVRRRVAAIATAGPPATFAAKAATSTIPILFLVGDDPARLGLVASLARPGGNLTGINIFNAELAAKRLELLRELVPRATRVAVLVNPADVWLTEPQLKAVKAAAPPMGLQIQVLNADSRAEIDAAFETIGRERPDAIFVGTSPFLNGRRVQLTQLAAFHRLPGIYALRDYAEVGGLMTYGSDIIDGYRQIGVYAGRILKGAIPSDLPVVQSSKFELVINASTAKMLGITVPDKLLVAADEVIE